MLGIAHEPPPLGCAPTHTLRGQLVLTGQSGLEVGARWDLEEVDGCGWSGTEVPVQQQDKA